MHRRGDDGALRHLDFTIFDILVMQFSFMLMFWASGHRGLIYANQYYRMQAVIFFSGQMALGLFSDVYDGILKRDAHEEFYIMLRYAGEIWLLCGVFILLANVQANFYELFVATLIYFDLGFFARQINKSRHLRQMMDKRKVVLITESEQVRRVVKKINHSQMSRDHQIIGICLLDDGDPDQFEDLEILAFNCSDTQLLDKISKWWIDDAFFLGTGNTVYPTELMENFLVMGITIHYSLDILDDFAFAKTDVQSIGDYKVISNSVNFVTDRALFIKRGIDIAAGLVGTFLTGIIFIFIAPLIYIKSPGPIFFSQNRMGQNGKVFKMYKFRSMYMDAEKRKAELLEKNKVQGGLMFKMDDDPRIIGSEKKGKDGKPKGIGNFIRNTSLDEFPQFFNVLMGDMSLVGTRPPTIDEWKQYEKHHRARLSVKPGITGMWQVSGRSKITDFEEVVRLDRKYLENWSVLLDIRIVIKTIMVVLKHEGAS